MYQFKYCRKQGVAMAEAGAKKLGELIGLIHDAGLDSTQWPTAITRMCSLLHASSALLFNPLHMKSPDWLIGACGQTADFLRGYAGRFHLADIWTQSGLKKQLFSPGKVLTGEELVPQELLFASDYYRDFLNPANISHLCCAVVFGQAESAARPTVMYFFRGREALSFKRQEKNLLRLLVPHIARSLAIARQLRATATAFEACILALDKIATGVLILDSEGQIIRMNSACRELLAYRENVITEKITNRAEPSMTPPDSPISRLHSLAKKMLASLPASAPSYGLLARPCGKSLLILAITPPPRSQEFDPIRREAAVIGYPLDPNNRRQPDAQLFTDIYQLTPAEIRLLGQLASGKSLGDISAATATSAETLKSQLKNIFHKTGTRRQSDLAGLVSALSATAPDEPEPVHPG